MAHSPMTNLLIDIYNGVRKLGIPTFQKLPDADEPEPFIVLGTHFDDDLPSGKFGKSVQITDLQIDMYYPIDSRVALEDEIYQVTQVIKQSTKRATRVTSNTSQDDSIGRDVYHVVFIVTAYM
ncbi:hypothetical protein KGX40_04885 [Leuconostoc fallax]|nr:hypothetical protein [Leuconostoc fallax]